MTGVQTCALPILDLALATDEHLLAVLSVAGLSSDVSSAAPEVIPHTTLSGLLCCVASRCISQCACFWGREFVWIGRF